MMLLAILAGLFLLRESHQPLGRSLDERWADWLSMNSRREAPPASPVALIAIDDNTLKSHPWPWTPLDYSLFFQASLTFHPSVLAVEEVLNWDNTPVAAGERQKLAQYERILKDVLLRSPKTVLGARLGYPDDPQTIPPLQATSLIRNVTGDLQRIPEWTVIEAQPAETYRLSASLGFTNLPTGAKSHNVVPLVLRYRGHVVPSFVLQNALLWYKLSADDVKVVLGSHLALGEKVRIPIDERGQMRVNFGVPRTVFSFEDLLLAAEQFAAKTAPVIPAERLMNGTTILARTDAASRTLPVLGRGKISPGEFFTSGLATIQAGWFITRAPASVDWAIIAAVAFFSLWIPRFQKRTVALIACAVLIAYAFGAYFLFSRELIWLPALLPLGLFLFVVLYRMVTPNWAAKPRRPVLM
jgi:hypothetical protein